MQAPQGPHWLLAWSLGSSPLEAPSCCPPRGPILQRVPAAPSHRPALPHGSTAGVVLNLGPCGHCQHWDVPSSWDHLGCHEAHGVPTELQDNSKGDTESAAGEDRQPGSAAVDQELLKS